MNLEIPSVRIDGLSVSRLDRSGTVELITTWLTEGREKYYRVATANLDFLRQRESNLELVEALDSSDLVTADGMPVVWLSRLTQQPIKQRVAGSTLAEDLLARAAEKGWRVYFLGGAPGTAQGAARCAVSRWPDLRVAGAEGPRLDLNDGPSVRRVCERIRESEADLLFVGLGCPKQELFLERWQERCGSTVGIGIGGSFDFLSGQRTRAPRLLQRMGAEWIWRLACEPRRLFSRYLKSLCVLPGIAWRTRAAAHQRSSAATP